MSLTYILTTKSLAKPATTVTFFCQYVLQVDFFLLFFSFVRSSQILISPKQIWNF